jgi:hypothetical protein
LNGTNVVVVFVIIFVGVRVNFNISTPNSGVVGPGLTKNILDYSVHLHQYGFDTGRLTSLKYKVKACSDVNVYLSNSLVMDSSMPLYEVSVGGYYNTKMLMLRRSDDSLQRETMIDVFPGGISTNADSDRLNCNKYMSFWVSWKRGHLKLGSGNTVHVNVIGDWVDPFPFTVRSIGISTTWGSTGKWKIQIKGRII